MWCPVLISFQQKSRERSHCLRHVESINTRATTKIYNIAISQTEYNRIWAPKITTWTCGLRIHTDNGITVLSDVTVYVASTRLFQYVKGEDIDARVLAGKLSRRWVIMSSYVGDDVHNLYSSRWRASLWAPDCKCRFVICSRKTEQHAVKGSGVCTYLLCDKKWQDVLMLSNFFILFSLN